MRVSTYPTIWGKMKRYITFLYPYRNVSLCTFMHNFIFFHDQLPFDSLPKRSTVFASRSSIALLCFECDNPVAFVLPFDFDTMCEIKNTIKFSFSKESDKPNIGEAVNFVKSLDADHGQVDAIYRMAEESAIYVKWKSEEAMLHVLTHNSDDLIFHYANGKQTSICMSHAQDYIF